jgi:RsiW-degrading membrane proteinase PrsW (M82 family)
MGEFFNDGDKNLKKLPLEEIFGFRYLQKKSFLWIIFFGITPLLILYVHTHFKWRFERSAWVLGAYFCLIWGINFHMLIKPSRDDWSRGILYAAFTALVGVPLLMFIQDLGIIRMLYKAAESEIYLLRVIGFVFGVGILEETCKLLPILIFGIRKKQIFSLKQGLFLGLMSGLGFALAEAVYYTLMYWKGSAIISLSESYKSIQNSELLIKNLTDYYGSLVIVQTVRFMTLPLFHAIWTGICSWFAVAASFRYPIDKKLIVIGVFFMAVVHGFYDVYSGTIQGVTIAISTIFIFMGYLTYSDKIEQFTW